MTYKGGQKESNTAYSVSVRPLVRTGQASEDGVKLSSGWAPYRVAQRTSKTMSFMLLKAEVMP